MRHAYGVDTITRRRGSAISPRGKTAGCYLGWFCVEVVVWLMADGCGYARGRHGCGGREGPKYCRHGSFCGRCMRCVHPIRSVRYQQQGGKMMGMYKGLVVIVITVLDLTIVTPSVPDNMMVVSSAQVAVLCSVCIVCDEKRESI